MKVKVGVRGGSCNGLAVLIAKFNTEPENGENMQAHFWLSGNHCLSQWSQMSRKGTVVPSCFRPDFKSVLNQATA